MTEMEFSRIRKFVQSNYGIDLSNKKALTEGRLDLFLSNAGFHTYSEYMDVIESPFSEKERETLVDLITTNHTFFMREFELFEYFRDNIMPELKVRQQQKKDLRIWSAASSTGEEPYTIAMIIRDSLCFEYSEWNTTILATDLSLRVLEDAIKGKYKTEAVQTLPQAWQKNYFYIGEKESEVRQEIKDHVMFRHFNLINPFPFRDKMQVIFLRNVMIYFNDVTKRELLTKICENLEPGGYLIIGSTEAINREGMPLEFVRPSIFRRVEEGRI